MNHSEHSSEQSARAPRFSSAGWQPALLPLLFLLLTPLLSSGQTNDAISREISVFNFGQASANVEAISREVSLFNFGVPSANVEAISREVSVFNFGLPSAGIEAISREVSVFNYGVPPIGFSIGSTNALKDEPNRVPFTFQTVLDLTNLDRKSVA